MNNTAIEDFIRAACVPRDQWHASGKLEQAQSMLADDPALAKNNIYTASITGNEESLRYFISMDPANAILKGGPYDWDPLTYLCFSRFLQSDSSRSSQLVRCAKILLEAGASANTGWWEKDHQPKPEWEPVLYGAAGIAHHPELTRLLLDWGADPNDIEVVYHSPETDDNRAMEILIQSGKITDENLILMLIRKHDWHDYDGAKMILATGVDPNIKRIPGRSAILHSIQRDNNAVFIQLLLDHGADPTINIDGVSAVSLAARRGRNDLLEMFDRYQFSTILQGVEKLIAACARNDESMIGTIKQNEPALVNELLAQGGKLLAEFAGTGNCNGVLQLLKLGVPVTALYPGDGYFGIPGNSMAIHVAAWKAYHEIVKILIDNGSPVNVPDGNGKLPLYLAVRACTDSFWMYRRSAASIKILLASGAQANGITLPTGYPEADALLNQQFY